jgi:hypothetical protein
MLWVLVVLFWVLFLGGFTLWLRPRMAALERRREVIGDRHIDGGTQARTISLCVAGAVAAMAVAIAAGLGALGALLGSIVVAAMLAGVVYLTVRDAEEAQQR